MGHALYLSRVRYACRVLLRMQNVFLSPEVQSGLPRKPNSSIHFTAVDVYLPHSSLLEMQCVLTSFVHPVVSVCRLIQGTS